MSGACDGREETEAAYEDACRLLLDAVALSFYCVQLVGCGKPHPTSFEI